MDTYAWCLVRNHFHLLLRVKPLAHVCAPDLTIFTKLSNLGVGPGTAPKGHNPEQAAQLQLATHDIVSHQFRKFFQSYAMAFNKQQQRVGTLFQTPFKRGLVDTEQYLKYLVYYIHANPQEHGMTEDFRDWPWSSYHAILAEQTNTVVDGQRTMDLFGNKQVFIDFHKNPQVTYEVPNIMVGE